MPRLALRQRIPDPRAVPKSPAPPQPSPTSDSRPIILAIVLVFLGGIYWTVKDEIPEDPPPAVQAKPTATLERPQAVPSIATARNTCAAALPSLRRLCPRAGDLRLERCIATERAVTAQLDARQIGFLQPGQYVTFGEPGPEWFVRDDGTVLTNNGLAMQDCDGVPNVTDFIADQVRSAAESRSKGEEGCTGKEVRAAILFARELDAASGNIVTADDLDRAEKTAQRKAAKRLGIKRSQLLEIWWKVTEECPEVVTGLND